MSGVQELLGDQAPDDAGADHDDVGAIKLGQNEGFLPPKFKTSAWR
jgi:hypothetical protein